jgi:hypothetical protein
MVKIFLAFSFLFTTLIFQCAGQDVSGYWKGTLNMRGCFPENNIELQINAKGNIVAGDSYHYQDIDNYVKKSFRGSYDRASKKLIVQEGTCNNLSYSTTLCYLCQKFRSLIIIAKETRKY